MKTEHKKNISDFAFQLGKLMGTMANLEGQNLKHPDVPIDDWNRLKDAINKVAINFYKFEDRNEKETN